MIAQVAAFPDRSLGSCLDALIPAGIWVGESVGKFELVGWGLWGA